MVGAPLGFTTEPAFESFPFSWLGFAQAGYVPCEQTSLMFNEHHQS
jgi:hypothetical protein